MIKEAILFSWIEKKYLFLPLKEGKNLKLKFLIISSNTWTGKLLLLPSNMIRDSKSFF